MEAIAPVSSAEIGAIGVHFRLAQLRGHCLPRIHRVLVPDPPNHLRRIDAAVVVERHAVLLVAVQALQHVHIVGHSDVTMRILRNVVIPCGPRTPALRQYARIRVQHRFVVLVANDAEHLLFDGRRFDQQCKGLVAMAGKKYCVVPFAPEAFRDNLDAGRIPDNRFDRCFNPNTVAVPRDQLVDVLP